MNLLPVIKKLLYVLYLCTTISFSQSNKFFQKTYTKQNGIELDIINSICFDNNGFLWLGGSNLDNRSIIYSEKKLSLQRFNGHSFHSINLPKYKNEIKEILQLYKRRDGKIYLVAKLARGYKLLLFDPYLSTFTLVAFKDSVFTTDGLSKLISYNNEDYLLLQEGDTVFLKKINLDLTFSEVFSFSNIKNMFSIDTLSTIVPFEDFVMISDYNFPVKVFNWKGKLLKTIKVTNNTPKQKIMFIDDVFVKNKTHFVFFDNNSNLYKIDEATKDIVPVGNNNLPSTHLNTYNDTDENTMLFASQGKTISFSSIKNQRINEEYLINIKAAHGIYIASKSLKKEIWLATNGALHYFKFPSNVIKNYLPNHQFRAIKPLDSLNYLVSSESNGWYKINPTAHTISPYKIKLNTKNFKAASRNFIIEDSIIWTNGNSGILKVNTKTRLAKSYRHFPILCLEKPNDSIIVYGTNGYNLMQFNTKTEKHKPLVKTDSLHIYDIEIQKHNNLIIAATSKGLLTYNLASKKSKFYNAKADLEDSYLLMVDFHKDYGYLLGSRSGHIYTFNPDKETFKTLYKDDLKAGIATILFHENLWWINTFNGIVTFNPKDQTTTRFSEKDGLSHYETNRYSALKTRDEKMFVGTIKGLNYFYPNDLKTQKDSAELVLLKVKHFNTTEKEFKNNFNQSTFNTSNYSITLPTENRALDIDFGLKNINAFNNGYTFKYKLDEKNWVELKDKNNIQFPNLSAGNYTLEIVAENYSGKKVGKSLILKINSKEFFYKTWWFFSLISVIVISFLLWVLNQTQIRKRLQEQFSRGLLQSQEEERKRIAKELHDSIGQRLTLIKRKAQNTNQNEITNLTNTTLEEVRSISRGLYPPLLKQMGLSESIEQLIAEVDQQTKLFVFGEVDKIDDCFNEIESLNCYRFIQECINNNLKHARSKALSISILKTYFLITINIKDDGIGFDFNESEKLNSLGLKTMYERIRILGGELTIKTKINKGTHVMAKIPVKHD